MAEAVCAETDMGADDDAKKKEGEPDDKSKASASAPATPSGGWGSLRGLFAFGSGEKSTATKATLGDEMSMYYDEKLKRWVDPVRGPAPLCCRQHSIAPGSGARAQARIYTSSVSLRTDLQLSALSCAQSDKSTQEAPAGLAPPPTAPAPAPAAQQGDGLPPTASAPPALGASAPADSAAGFDMMAPPPLRKRKPARSTSPRPRLFGCRIALTDLPFVAAFRPQRCSRAAFDSSPSVHATDSRRSHASLRLGRHRYVRTMHIGGSPKALALTFGRAFAHVA